MMAESAPKCAPIYCAPICKRGCAFGAPHSTTAPLPPMGAFGATAVSKEILKAITAATEAGVPFQEIAERLGLDPAAWATLLDNHRSCCPLARIASVVGLIDVPLENRGG